MSTEMSGYHALVTSRSEEDGIMAEALVDFENVSVAGLERSPVAEALAGLRANEARYYMNKYKHAFRPTV